MEWITIYRVESEDHSIVSAFYEDINDANAELERMRNVYTNSSFKELKPYTLLRRVTLS